MEENFPTSTYNRKSGIHSSKKPIRWIFFWDRLVLMIDSIRKKSTSTYNRNLRVFSIRCLPFYRCKMYFPLLCLSILFASVASQDESLFEVGDFQNHAHGISGKVFVKDEKTLIIKGKIFKYIFLSLCLKFLQ